MAYYQKRGENTYRLVASTGYDDKGKNRRKTRNITLRKGMTEKQIEDELNRLTTLFQEEVNNGLYLDGEKITFSEFANKWLKEFAEKNLAVYTLKYYEIWLEQRINPAIGHIKMAKLQPNHLMEFYNNLREEGIRFDTKYRPKKVLIEKIENSSSYSLEKSTGVSLKTCQRIKRGETVTPAVAEKLCDALKLNKKKMFVSVDADKKLSDKSVRNIFGVVSSILGKAVKWNVIKDNPAERVDLGKKHKYKPDYYDDEQITEMFTMLESEPLYHKAMIYFAVDSGAREGEIAGLMWSDINFDNQTVTITRQRQYVDKEIGIIEKPPKTDSGLRPITLSDTVAALMKQYKEQQSADKMMFGDAWKNDNEYVFVHRDGTVIHPQFPYRMFTAFLLKHKLPKITFHQLRHTNASLLIAAGVDVVTLSGRLGHSDKNITLNTYSHIIKSKEVEAANKMELFYKRKNNKKEP